MCQAKCIAPQLPPRAKRKWVFGRASADQLCASTSPASSHGTSDQAVIAFAPPSTNVGDRDRSGITFLRGRLGELLTDDMVGEGLLTPSASSSPQRVLSGYPSLRMRQVRVCVILPSLLRLAERSHSCGPWDLSGIDRSSRIVHVASSPVVRYRFVGIGIRIQIRASRRQSQRLHVHRLNDCQEGSCDFVSGS
jgi:hypothetical protein